MSSPLVLSVCVHGLLFSDVFDHNASFNKHYLSAYLVPGSVPHSGVQE